MKKLFALFSILFGFMSVSAQSSVEPENGYYRVQNYGSQRYVYLCDKTGSIDYTTQNADVGAMQLWKDINRTYDNPGSVIYIKHVTSTQCDLMAQGTGVYETVGHYVSIEKSGDNKYYVYASKSGVSKYLSDSRTNNSDQGVPSFNGKGNYRLWSVFPINTTDNYIGITPTISYNGKYYAPYYVGFPFKFHSSGMKAYYIKNVDKELGVAVMEEITTEIIPAEMPVIIECASAESNGNIIVPVVDGTSVASDNLLGGVYFCNPDRISPYVGTPFNATTMRTLGLRADGKVGFISTPDNLTDIEINYVSKACLPANSSYLKVSNGTPSELLMMNQTDYESYVVANRQKAASISLDQTTASLNLGQTVQLTATVLPDNTYDKTVTWTSGDVSVATVSDKGVVKAVSVGTVTITVTTNDGSNLSATCKVTVNPTLVTSITLSQTVASLHVGESIQLSANVLPSDATDKTVSWTSSDINTVTVEDGKITAVGVGSATIIAKAKDASGIVATCEVVVKPIYITSLVVNPQTASMQVGETLQLTATYYPQNATDKTLIWTSSNPAVVTVSNDGKVSAIGDGTAIVKVATADGSNLSSTCKITVAPVLVTSVQLSALEAALHVGGTVELTATVFPENATNPVVIWATSDPSVATVVDGKVTAVGVGTANITATTTDGTNLTSACKVTVTAIPVESITLNQTVAELMVGDQLQLTATVTPENATNKTLIWTSSNTEVATVNENGLVTVVGEGTAVITVTASDGSLKSAKCSISVQAKIVYVSEVLINQSEAELTMGSSLQLEAIVQPSDATNSALIWTTSDAAVATVDPNGLVTAINEGEAVITATTVDGTNLSASCKVSVKPIYVEKITLNETETELYVGNILQLIAEVQPTDATNIDVEWTTSDETIATVDETGLVTALGEGDVVIRATAVDGSNISASCLITCKINPFVGIRNVLTYENVVAIYTLDGRRMARISRGINIVRFSDGTVRKILVK